jgi:hypothetical protein
MRIRILRPRTDTVTAAEVRAVREGRGWTTEQMADAVQASPLEVEAWEAGSVQPPPLQAARAWWMLETDRRAAAFTEIGRGPCGWLRKHAPRLYEDRMGGMAWMPWYARSQEVRDHLDACAACRRAWAAIERLGPAPAQPDDSTFHTLQARYSRWVRRVPRRAQKPLHLLGGVPQVALAVLAIATMPVPDSGIAARITGAGLGALIGLGTYRMASDLLQSAWSRLPPFVRGFVSGAVACVPGVLFWGHFDSAVQPGNPRVWAAAAVVSVAAGLWARRRAAEDSPAPGWTDSRADPLSAADPRFLNATAPGPDALSGAGAERVSTPHRGSRRT